MASNLVLITSGGLQSINDASSEGIFIDVAYYVPVYDYRIDPNVSPITTASPSDITTVASAGDTYPQGEIFWKNDWVNTLSQPDQKFILSASGVTYSDSHTISSPVQKGATQITLGNGFPHSVYWTTDDVDAYYDLNSNSWIEDGSGWVTSGGLDTAWGPDSAYAGIQIPANLSNPGTKFVYSGVSYNSVITTGTDRSANFRVVVTSPNGTIKFNKLGLYAVKKVGSGQVNTAPFLFAEVIIPEPQIVSNDVASGKIGELVVDFQLDTKTVTSAFDNLFYSTSGDYWERVSNEEGTYGLAYDGGVYIANRLSTDDKNTWISTSADGGVAKLFVATFENLNGPTPDIEKTKPQACFQYVTQQTDTTSSKRIRTTFRTTSAGNFEVDMYGACLTGNPIYSITPKNDDEFGLGTYTQRWKTGRFSNNLSVANVVDDGDLYYYNAFEVNLTTKQVKTDGLDFYCNNETVYTPGQVINDKFYNGNLRAMTYKPLYIRTSVDPATGYDTDMWLMAGSWNTTKQGLGSITQWNSTDANQHGSNNDLVASSILDTYRTRAGSEAIFAEMVAHKGGLYLTGNGYIYMMGSAVFMEHPMPFVDDYIRLGVEDGVGEAGTPLAFRSVATHQLVNAGRDIKISSSLIPSLGDDGFVTITATPSLGSATNKWIAAYFSMLYSDAITVTNSITFVGGTTVINGSTIVSTAINSTTSNITTLRVTNLYVDNIIKEYWDANEDYSGTYLEYVAPNGDRSSANDFYQDQTVSIYLLRAKVNALAGTTEFEFTLKSNSVLAKVKGGRGIDASGETRYFKLNVYEFLATAGVTYQTAFGGVAGKSTLQYWSDDGRDIKSRSTDVSFSVVDSSGNISYTFAPKVTDNGPNDKNVKQNRDFVLQTDVVLTFSLVNAVLDSTKWTLKTS